MCRYEVATAEPLQHEETSTLVFVHSVNRFHAASAETARGMLALLRPEVLAVQLHNDMAPGIVDGARKRMGWVSGHEHVQRIADGYQRVCMGAVLLWFANTTCVPLQHGGKTTGKAQRS